MCCAAAAGHVLLLCSAGTEAFFAPQAAATAREHSNWRWSFGRVCWGAYSERSDAGAVRFPSEGMIETS